MQPLMRHHSDTPSYGDVKVLFMEGYRAFKTVTG